MEEGDDYGLVAAYPVPPPFADGWRISASWGDGDGFAGDWLAGDWLVGRSWDAHRNGAPVQFRDTNAPPDAQRLHTELVMLAAGVRQQQRALVDCRDAGDGACQDAAVLDAHARWLRRVEAWANLAALSE